METDIETKYCQSCGMPLDIEDISEYGTNSDGTLNQEFCSCCLNSGKYLLISQWSTLFIFGDFSPILIIKLLVRITKARN